MGVRDKELLRLAGWPGGIDNLHRETDIPATSLREAVNFDLSASGRPTPRRGWQQVVSGQFSAMHNRAFAAHLIAVQDGALVALDANLDATEIRAVLGTGPVSFAEVAGNLYWTNGIEIRRLTGDLRDTELWLPTPPQPTVSAVGAGGLVEGEYQVAITWADVDGRESGATMAELVDVAAGGGAMLSSIPQHADAVKAHVYVSEPGGEELRRAGTVAAGVTSWVIGAGIRGKPLETQFLEPLPPGTAVAYACGRLFVAVGKHLHWSEPHLYGLREAGHNYTTFPDTIDLLEPASDNAGLFVATRKPGTDGGRTVFMSANAREDGWTQRIVYGYGAVAGSSRQAPGSLFGLPHATVPYWLAANGLFCAGLPDGRVQVLTQDSFAAPAGHRAATLLRESDGYRQLITSVQGGPVNRMAVADSMTAEVRRHGVVVG